MDMRETNLISTLSQLKNIEPRHDWVVLTKNSILEPQKALQGGLSPFGVLVSGFSHLHRPALVMAGITVMVFGGIFLQAGKSLPGDRLYAVRSIVERAQLSELEVAQRRLSDLRKVAEANKVRNLSSAIREAESSVSDASRALALLVENDPSQALQLSGDFVQLQREKFLVEQILGMTIGDTSGEVESAAKVLLAAEIADLRTRSLTEEQTAELEKAQASYEEGKYEAALEAIWSVSNQL